MSTFSLPDRTRHSIAHIKAFAKKLAVPLSIVLPIVLLYIFEPTSFEFTWKGRFPYLFFLWLIFLEFPLAWRKFPKNMLNASKRTRTMAAAIVMAVPTAYVIVTFMFGLNQEIIELGKSVGVPYGIHGDWFIQVSWPLSFEYLLFTTFFTASILLTYGIKGLKRFSVSLFFLGATASFYMIDTFYPVGTLIFLQRLVPFSASSAVNTLNWMGYKTQLFHYGFTKYVDSMVIKEVVTVARISGGEHPLLFSLNWPCAGVHSLFIYTFVILLFLKNVTLSPQPKIIQAAIPKKLKLILRSKKLSFLLERKPVKAIVRGAGTFVVEILRRVSVFIVVVVGAIGTFIVNILRIVYIFVMAAKVGQGATNLFHTYHGELYFIVWITLYLLAIIYGPRIFTKLLRRKEVTIRQHGTF